MAPSLAQVPVTSYGVLEQNETQDELDVHVEMLRMQGYTVLDAGLTEEELDALSAAFDAVATSYRERFTGAGFDLEALGEAEVIRVMGHWEPAFFELAFHEVLHRLLRRVLGDYYVLNQTNGLINPAQEGEYSQHPFHRDLPFRHLTMSRPLALNALFALDDFTAANGATRVVPGSHHMEAFPSDDAVRRMEVCAEAPRGSFLVLDSMTFHAGGLNRSDRDRRAVNHVFTIPAFRQQLHLPSILGERPDLSPARRRILGYELDEFASHTAWFENRRARQDG